MHTAQRVNYKKAIESLNKLPTLDTRLKRVYQTLSYNRGGLSFFKSVLFNSSIAAFAAVNDHPVDSELTALSRYWIADAYYRQNKMQEAIANYKLFIGFSCLKLQFLKKSMLITT